MAWWQFYDYGRLERQARASDWIPASVVFNEEIKRKLVGKKETFYIRIFRLLKRRKS